MVFAGKNVFSLFGIESSFNTEATTIDKSIGIQNVSNPEWNNNNIMDKEFGDRETIFNQAGVFNATVGVEGTFNSGALLELFFGQSIETETTGDWKHVFVDGSNPLLKTAPSFSFKENFNGTSDIAYLYTGSKLNSIEISLERNNTLKFNGEVFASFVDTGSTIGSKVTQSTEPLVFSKADLATGDLGSETSVGLTRSFTLTFNNNIDADGVKAFGSRFNQALIEQNLDTTVSFTKSFANKTEADRFLGGTTPSTMTPTATSLIFKVDNGVGLGSGRVEFYVKITGGQYTRTSQTKSQQDIVEESYDYEGGRITEMFFVDQVTSYF